jgi:hypothetical protein
VSNISRVGGIEIRWLFGSWWITAVIRQVPYIRERENAFRVAAERRCHRAESAFTRVPGEQITRGLTKYPRAFYASTDVILGICNGVELSPAPSNVCRARLYAYVLFPRWNTLHILPLSSNTVASTRVCNYCFIFDTRVRDLRHRGLSMLRIFAMSRLNSFVALWYIYI